MLNVVILTVVAPKKFYSLGRTELGGGLNFLSSAEEILKPFKTTFVQLRLKHLDFFPFDYKERG